MEKRSSRRDLAVHIIKKNDNTSDLQFWQKKTPQERIDAVEFLRRQYYALRGCTTIPRITHIIQFRARHT
jgi:hypothetical protein